MKTKVTLIILLFALYSCKEERDNIVYNYPKIEKQSVTEKYCGIEVTDDYRNLENSKDSTVIEWYKEQEDFSKNLLNNISGKDELFEKMKDYATRSEYKTSSVKVLTNGMYFYLKSFAKDNASSLYMKNSLDGKEEFIFNPKTYNKDKEYQIRGYAPSWDGKKVAIALTYDGREFSEALILDLSSKKIIVEEIPNVWGAIEWLPDNSGISFMGLADNFEQSDDHFKEMNISLYRLGSKAEKREILFSKENNPELNMSTSDIPAIEFSNQNDKYVIGAVSGATAYHDLYYCNASKIFYETKANWKQLAKKENKVKKIRIYNDSILAITANNGDFKIVKGSLENIDWSSMNVLINPKENEVINDFEITSNGVFYTTLMNGVKAKLYHYEKGNSKEINMPTEAGYAIISNLTPNKPDLWVGTRGWLNNYKRYRYDTKKQTFLLEEMSTLAAYPEFKDFTVKEVEIEAHDGEKIPLSIIHKKGLENNGKNPTLLIGYGAYGNSYKPSFSTNWLTWVDYGGVLAIAHVRGGSEKGNTWYEGGKKETKPNTWKDMISCTEYMIEKKYTSNKKTVIRGSSAGGIMAGRSITERPDLYAVAIVRVGSLNTLRSEDAPNGDNNVKEFGSYKNPNECLSLLEMDSYTKIKDSTNYPATILTAGLNDPRVIAWSPGKFAARLQEKNISGNPILFYVQTNSGHGLGEGKWSSLKETANLFAFAFWQVGHGDFFLNKH